MLDMFGRTINVDDTVIFVVKGSTYANVKFAAVISVTEKKARVNVFAANRDSRFTQGVWKYDDINDINGHLSPFNGYEATITTPLNVLVANELDRKGLSSCLSAMQEKQRRHVAKANQEVA